jgi:hypothetical protein
LSLLRRLQRDGGTRRAGKRRAQNRPTHFTPHSSPNAVPVIEPYRTMQSPAYRFEPGGNKAQVPFQRKKALLREEQG